MVCLTLAINFQHVVAYTHFCVCMSSNDASKATTISTSATAGWYFVIH